MRCFIGSVTLIMRVSGDGRGLGRISWAISPAVVEELGLCFPQVFLPASCEVEEVTEGGLLKLKVQYENVKMIPCNAVERLHVLSILCDTVRNCSTDEFFIFGG